MNRGRIGALILLIALSLLVLVGCNLKGYGTESSGNISYSELIQKINSAGTQAETTTETLNESMFSVPGRIALIGNQRIQVYQYETSSSAKSLAKTVSPRGDMIGNGIVDWIDVPHFYRLGNMIVIYVGLNNDVTKALTAILGNQFAGG